MEERRQQRKVCVCVCGPVYLFAVGRDVEEEAASLQNHQNQVSQQLLVGDLGEVAAVSQLFGPVCRASFTPFTFGTALK